MNFKTVFLVATVAASIGILTSLFFLYQIGLPEGIVFLVIGVIKFTPVLMLFPELKKSIKQESMSENLKGFEIVSYFAFGLLIIGVLGSFNSIFFIVSDPYYEMSYKVLALLAVVIELISILVLVYAYKTRRNELGKFGKNVARSNHGDILDDLSGDYSAKQQFPSVEERIELCQICTKKGFNTKIGIVCSLTDAKPNFIESCSTYETDEKAKVLHKKTQAPKVGSGTGSGGSWKGALVMSVFGFARAAMKGFDDIFGIIFLCLGVLWLVIALFSGDRR